MFKLNKEQKREKEKKERVVVEYFHLYAFLCYAPLCILFWHVICHVLWEFVTAPNCLNLAEITFDFTAWPNSEIINPSVIFFPNYCEKSLCVGECEKPISPNSLIISVLRSGCAIPMSQGKRGLQWRRKRRPEKIRVGCQTFHRREARKERKRGPDVIKKRLRHMRRSRIEKEESRREEERPLTGS